MLFSTSEVRSLKGIRSGTLKEVAESPLLLLCVPISQISKTCLEIKPYLTPGQLIIDTCSVKERPLQEMKRLLPRIVEIWAHTLCSGPTALGTGFAD